MEPAHQQGAADVASVLVTHNHRASLRRGSTNEWGAIESWSRSAPAAWARCTARSTSSRAERSRSSSCARPRPGTSRRKIEALFEREYHTLVQLKHPRIIEVYDYGVDRAPGRTTRWSCSTGTTCSSSRRCRGARRAASCATWPRRSRCCTRAGCVHRDVSAAQRALTADGRAKLIDFGALTAFGTAHERGRHAAVHGARGAAPQPLDQRTDLYALGAVAYCALTGAHAYPARSSRSCRALWRRPPHAARRARARDPAQALDALVMSLLSLDPLARPASAAAVIDRLTAIARARARGARARGRELPVEQPRWSGGSASAHGCGAGSRARSSGAAREVLIEGASGIGKTRLLHELAPRGAAQGHDRARGRRAGAPRPVRRRGRARAAAADALPRVARGRARRRRGLARAAVARAARAASTVGRARARRARATRPSGARACRPRCTSGSCAVAAQQPLLHRGRQPAARRRQLGGVPGGARA